MWALCGSGRSAVCLVSADERVGSMALRPSIRVRTRIVYVFIVSPEEILHYCVHSSVPFGVAGRLTARIIAYFVRRRKWTKWRNASSIYLREGAAGKGAVPAVGRRYGVARANCRTRLGFCGGYIRNML